MFLQPEEFRQIVKKLTDEGNAIAKTVCNCGCCVGYEELQKYLKENITELKKELKSH